MAVVPISTSHLTSSPLWRSPSLSLSLSASPSSCSSSCVLFGSSAIRRTSSLCAASPFLPSNKRILEIRCAGGRDVSIPLEQRWMFEPSEVNGPDIWNKTWYPKASDHDNKKKTWYIVDATDKILGRMASTIAIHMRGKNLVTFTPSVDMGAYVIVVNAEKVAVSGKKRSQKLYRRHSGRPGGMKIETFDQLQKRIPERIVEHAVRGMLPKGRLGRTLFTHLKVYKGPDHPHEAQKPKELPIHDKRILATK